MKIILKDLSINELRRFNNEVVNELKARRAAIAGNLKTKLKVGDKVTIRGVLNDEFIIQKINQKNFKGEDLLGKHWNVSISMIETINGEEV